MLSSLLVSEVTTTQFYKTGDVIGHYLAIFFVIVLASGLLFATVKYVKR